MKNSSACIIISYFSEDILKYRCYDMKSRKVSNQSITNINKLTIHKISTSQIILFCFWVNFNSTSWKWSGDSSCVYIGLLHCTHSYNSLYTHAQTHILTRKKKRKKNRAGIRKNQSLINSSNHICCKNAHINKIEIVIKLREGLKWCNNFQKELNIWVLRSRKYKIHYKNP